MRMITITVDQQDAISVARMSAIAIREAVKKKVHMSGIKAMNLHLDRFREAMEIGLAKRQRVTR